VTEIGDDLDRIAGWLADARYVTVLTGAGISTDSGIPDFRGPNGVWTKNPAAEKMATLQHYMGDPEVRKAAWRNRRESPAWNAQPNAGHHAIVELQRLGKLHAVVTQNVDELHQRAGTDPDLVIEVHGTMRHVICMTCSETAPMERVLDRVDAGEEDPPCRTCGGILKSATISFGQSLVPEVIDRAYTVAEEADVLLAVGTTLGVYPAANVVPIAKRNGAYVVILNAEPTEMDMLADVVIRGSISEILPMLTAP
jgi:NAD-dependent deacetylase